MFSDQSRFTLDFNGRRNEVWRHCNVRLYDVNIMAWVASRVRLEQICTLSVDILQVNTTMTTSWQLQVNTTMTTSWQLQVNTTMTPPWQLQVNNTMTTSWQLQANYHGNILAATGQYYHDNVLAATGQ